jgi:1-pyrroline-4-hydroxy-2-carboxylate deaminase
MISVEQAKERWQGVVGPLVTPFREDLSVDLDALQRNVQWILDRGARQGNTIFLVAGSGGDFTSMNLGERLQVIRAVAEVTAGRLPIIAGAQSNDIRECIAICQLCDELKIDGVQISGPFYYDGRPADTVAWMEELARHTKVGFALYNNWYTGYDMPISLIERLLEIPNSVAVKWGSPNVVTFLDGIRRFLPRAAVVMNNRHLVVTGHMMGSRGMISHFINFFPEYPWKVWELLQDRRYEEAQKLLDDVMPRYEVLRASIAGVTAGEGVFVRPSMDLVGLTGGRSRLPSRDEAVTPELREGFRRLLCEIGAIA